MARPGRPQRNRAARSYGPLRRFHHVINSDEVFGTHRQGHGTFDLPFDHGSARWPAMGHGKHTPRGHVSPHPAAERRHSVVSLAPKPTGEQASGRELSS